jgi:hypothetical protein
MKLETGEPVLDGRYLVYVPSFGGFLEPVIVSRVKGEWCFRNSEERYADTNRYWVLLPVLKYEPQTTDQEYVPYSGNMISGVFEEPEYDL